MGEQDRTKATTEQLARDTADREMELENLEQTIRTTELEISDRQTQSQDLNLALQDREAMQLRARDSVN